MNQNHDHYTYEGGLAGSSLAKAISRPLASAALIAVATLFFGGTALAEKSQEHHGAASSGHGASHSSFSYNYAELRLISITANEPGPVDLDGDGFEFEGSIGIGDKYQAYALYEDIGFDHDIDLSEWAVGFGAHLAIMPGMDFVAELGYISEEIKEPGQADHSDDGYLLGVGLRKKIGQQGEIQFGINYVDFSTAGSVTSYELVGEMHVLPNLAIGVGIDAGSEATAYFAEARFYFGGH